MTEGKLVRDRIPEIIRASGRAADVRYLTGDELSKALAAKLIEEAREAADVVDDRDRLIEELADLSEVTATLMARRSIQQWEVEKTAQSKAALRGRFELGVWLGSEG